MSRSGQRVIKSAGTNMDGVQSNAPPLSGSKRSIKQRLENNVENKRHRGNSGGDRFDDVRVGHNDLRLKLMQKRLSRQANSHDEEGRRMEQRERQSRIEHPFTRSTILRQMSPTKESTLFMKNSGTASADDFFLRQPLRESHSSWTVNGLKHRSPPDRVLRSYRGLTPLNHAGNLNQVPAAKPIDASRNGRYLSNEFPNSSRPNGPTHMTMNDASEYGKPIASVPAHTQPTSIHPNSISMSGIVQKSYMGEEPFNVPGLLNALGLGKYAILFQAEEVDMTALKQMKDSDLKELGLPMGPRKKILLALTPRSKRQQS